MPPPPVPKKKHERGVVTVTVVSARELRDCERFAKMDPYVTVRLGDCALHTQVVAGGGTDPVFDETMTYHVEERPTVLLVDAWDKERIGADDHIGSGELPIGKGSRLVGAAMTAWVPLVAPDDGREVREDSGQVQVQVRFTPDGTPLTLSGYLEKKSPSWPKWDKRFFELRGSTLAYFSEDASGAKRAAGEVSLLDCTDAQSSAAPGALEGEWELFSSKRTFRLAAASDEECMKWIDACRAVIPADVAAATATAEEGTPTRDDAMAEGEATPRGRSAPRETAAVRKYLAAMVGKPVRGEDLFESLKSGVLLCELVNRCGFCRFATVLRLFCD